MPERIDPADQAAVALLVQLHALEQDPSYEGALVDLGPYSSWLIVSAIQLALRHPSVDGTLAGQLEQLGRTLAGTLPEPYRAMLAAGWDTSQDVPQ